MNIQVFRGETLCHRVCRFCISYNQSASSPGLSDPEDEGIMILQHINSHSNPERFAFSKTSL